MSYHSAATFRFVGSAATAQNFLTIMNNDPSKVVRVRRMTMQMDTTVLLAVFMPIVRTCRISAASAGTLLAKTDWDSAAASDADITVRGCSSADGTNTLITATPTTLTIWQQFGMRMHTLVGQILGLDNNCIPLMCETSPIVLRPGEGLLCHIVAAATTSNPATNHYFINVAWTEDAS